MSFKTFYENVRLKSEAKKKTEMGKYFSTNIKLSENNSIFPRMYVKLRFLNFFRHDHENFPQKLSQTLNSLQNLSRIMRVDV